MSSGSEGGMKTRIKFRFPCFVATMCIFKIIHNIRVRVHLLIAHLPLDSSNPVGRQFALENLIQLDSTIQRRSPRLVLPVQLCYNVVPRCKASSHANPRGRKTLHHIHLH